MKQQKSHWAGLICQVVGLVVLFAASTSAFDNQRRGFNLGGGFGLGLASYTQTISGGQYAGTSSRQNPLAIMTDLKIGGAPSDQVQIYYISRASWFSMQNVFEDEVVIANVWNGLGVSYYFQPQAPSPYLTGSFGFSTWSATFESDSEEWYGIGVTGGAGYEFVKHWSVEGVLAYGKPSNEEGGIKVTANSFAFRVTLAYNAY